MDRYLIVIDMQHDFVDGALGTPEARAILPAVAELVETFPGTVLFTRDTHGEDYLNTQEGRLLPVPHCIRGTPGWELASPLDQFTRDHGCLIFDKPTFGSRALADHLEAVHRERPMGQVVLAGVCTDICVISNALAIKAALPEVPMAVLSSCCAGVTPERHQNALDAMAACQISILPQL